MEQSIWLLLDNRAGNRSQAMGVSDQLTTLLSQLPGEPWQVINKEIIYNKMARLPNFVGGQSLIGIDIAKSDILQAPWPRIVISAGRRTAKIALWIKKQNPQTFVCQIMDPAFNRSQFDLLALPAHDRLNKPYNAGNTIRFFTAPHRVTAEKLLKESERWRDMIANLPRPYVMLICGGDSKAGKLTADQAQNIARQSSQFAQKIGGSLLVTTSRRTSKAAEDALRLGLSWSHYFYSPNDSAHSGNNPYLGFLGLADYIIATGDSVSMISEACFTAKPVYIFDEVSSASKKHRRFIAALVEAGKCRKLSQSSEVYQYQVENSAYDIALNITSRVASRVGSKTDFRANSSTGKLNMANK
jgi:mitochondrial fission protein ELM1